MKTLLLIALIGLASCGKTDHQVEEIKCQKNYNYNGYKCIKTVTTITCNKNEIFDGYKCIDEEKTVYGPCHHLMAVADSYTYSNCLDGYNNNDFRQH